MNTDARIDVELPSETPPALPTTHGVMIGVPCGGGNGLHPQLVHALMGLIGKSRHSWWFSHASSSAALLNFNLLLCQAREMNRLNPKVDRFVMICTDVVPVIPNWLDVLLAEMDKSGADIIGGLAPIKTRDGFTSTAFDTNRWNPRRLTMKEAMLLPETFACTPELEARYGGKMLVNLSLAAFRLDAPWIKDMSFSWDVLHWPRPDGGVNVYLESEDWRMSRWANERQLKLVATRAVPFHHMGEYAYRNDCAWGTAETDHVNLRNAELAKEGMAPT